MTGDGFNIRHSARGPALKYNFCLVFTVLYLTEKYCKNPKVPGAQLKVNPARAVTWFVGVTIYCTFFNNHSPPPGQFLCNKKKLLATVWGMLIEQIFELRGPGPPGRIFTPIPGCFHDKTIISRKIFD